MIGGANVCSGEDEDSCNRVADPDAKPGLPPGEANNDARRGNHPCVDIERVGNPEADIIPGTPLPAGGFNWRLVMLRVLR